MLILPYANIIIYNTTNATSANSILPILSHTNIIHTNTMYTNTIIHKCYPTPILSQTRPFQFGTVFYRQVQPGYRQREQSWETLRTVLSRQLTDDFWKAHCGFSV